MLRNNIKREYPDRPISAVAGVVIHNNSVLLVKKSNLEELWSFPGGAIEIGETLHEALTREVLEETSIIIKVGDQIENVNVIRKDANDKKFSEDAYTAEDDFWKIFTFLGEQRKITDAYKAKGLQFGDDVVAAKWHQISKINEIKLIDGASRILKICGY